MDCERIHRTFYANARSIHFTRVFSDHARESGFSFKRTLSSDVNVVTKPRTDDYDMSSMLQILSGKAFLKRLHAGNTITVDGVSELIWYTKK